MSLILTKSLLNYLTDEKYIHKKFQVLPNEIIDETPYLKSLFDDKPVISHIEEDLLIEEIFISKSTFIKIFTECFKYIYEDNYERINCDKYFNNDKYLQDDTYVATMGLILITPLDSTAVNLNEKLRSPYSQLQDFYIICGYLTCNFEKTNKSSILWTYFKKKLVLFHNDDKIIKYSIDVILRSIKEHPRNYYACNALRFVVSNYHHLRKYITQILLEWCIKNLDDLSVWLVLLQCICKIEDESFYVEEFERYCFLQGDIKILNNNTIEEIDVLETYEKLRKWGYGGGFGSYNVWFALAIINKFVNIDNNNLKLEMFNIIDQFQQKYGLINIRKGCLVKNNEVIYLNNDLLLKEKFNNVLNIKRVYNNKIVNSKNN